MSGFSASCAAPLFEASPPGSAGKDALPQMHPHERESATRRFDDMCFRHRVCLFYASRLLLSHPRDWVVCFAVMRLSWSTTSYNGGAHIKVEYGGDAWLALGVSADGHMVRKNEPQKKEPRKRVSTKQKTCPQKHASYTSRWPSHPLAPPPTPSYPNPWPSKNRFR